MSWLRKRIDEEWAGNYGDAPDTEAIARAFAERACRKLLPIGSERWAMDNEAQDRLVAEALAAADEEGK